MRYTPTPDLSPALQSVFYYYHFYSCPLFSFYKQLLLESQIHMFLKQNIKNVVFLDEIDSTNRYLLQGDFPSGTSCLANFQTAGRGRRGRSWISKAGDAFLYSGVLEASKHLLFRRPPLLPLLSGLAIRKSILDFLEQNGQNTVSKKLTPRLQIKWPNDLVYQISLKTNETNLGTSPLQESNTPQKNTPKKNKLNAKSDSKKEQFFWGKLAGVLVESKEHKNTVRLVIGIGLNWRGRPPLLHTNGLSESEDKNRGFVRKNTLSPSVLFPKTEKHPRELLPFLLVSLNHYLRLYYEESDQKILQEIRMNFYLKERLYLFRGRLHRVLGLSDEGLLLLEGKRGDVFSISEAE